MCYFTLKNHLENCGWNLVAPLPNSQNALRSIYTLKKIHAKDKLLLKSIGIQMGPTGILLDKRFKDDLKSQIGLGLPRIAPTYNKENSAAGIWDKQICSLISCLTALTLSSVRHL